MTASSPAGPGRLLLAAEGAAAVLFALTLCAWFAGRPGVPAAVPAAGLALVGVLRLALGGGLRWRPPRLDTALCLGLAVLYRLPALLHPWAWVNRDGAYGAFVALHLLDGTRPAPPFTEGANYQGTLKSHLAALLALTTGVRDLSWLMVAASLLLYLVFVAAAMALARRVGGRAAAVACGSYLAVAPRFLTVFSLNCVGQYVDVLALGGAALALTAAVLQEDRAGAPARGWYFGIGALLGAAFWQQPVALSYAAACAVALGLRRRTWRDPWALAALVGLGLGALPVLLWNAQNGWASADILGRNPSELQAQADALPHLARRTLLVSFPILAGLSPGHPWSEVPGLLLAAALLIPTSFLGYVIVRARPIAHALRRGKGSADLLAPLVVLFCIGLFWAIASGRVYWRPRYLLPLLAATALHLGVIAAWAWTRARPVAVLGMAALLAVNLAGTLPRLRESRGLAEHYVRIVRSLEEKGIRTGYADFSLSAPVTMFTAERIVLSSQLGPTPAYESERHARRVEREGPDAYVLRPEDDVNAFAAGLHGLGASFQLDREPVPVFHALSRRVGLDEVAGFRPGARGPEGDE